jgi:hypothetical protein
MPSLPGWPRGSRRRRTIVLGLWALVVLGAALVVLAIPLAKVPGDARAADRDLKTAKAALEAGDLESARASVASARDHIDSAQGGTEGIGGDVWSRIPVLGTPVADARHLVQALDDVAAVATIGVDLYPSMAGDRATLFRHGQVDRETLDTVLAKAREAGARLSSAESELTQVKGSSPIVGDTISARRDEAADQVIPLADGFTRLAPLLDELPAFLGFEGKRTYLIAMLNPAELRYSGGAALAFAPMSWDDGRLDLGEAFGLPDDPRIRNPHTWPRVKGNVFHRRDVPLVNATFAPSWSVSGEELLRAWHRATADNYDGVVAVDVVTMAQLLGVTGPTTVPGLGTLTSDNLVETLVGSYDDYYPDPSVQDRSFAAIVVSLQARLFSGGKYVDKGRALKDAADGRHLALYLRDPDVQDAFAALGLDGDLAEPTGDYLGVFTQSTVGSKVDYWQRRDLSLDVILAGDGTATDRLDVLLHNDTPPYAAPEPDPREGYFTRWSSIAASAFLPGDVRATSFSVGKRAWNGHVGTYYDHAFLTQQTVIPPGGSTRIRAAYSVPGAAETDESGNLTYRLAVDPQGTVFPASAEVTVHVPEGYRATAVPEGWTAQGSVLTFHTGALTSSEEWEITLEATT